MIDKLLQIVTKSNIFLSINPRNTIKLLPFDVSKQKESNKIKIILL
jgi:hypothetical protein